MFINNFKEREVWKCNLTNIESPDQQLPGINGRRVCLIIMSNRYNVTVLPFTTKVDKYKISDDLIFHLEEGFTSVPCFHSIKTISKKDIITTEFYGVMHIDKYNLIIQTIYDIAIGKIIPAGNTVFENDHSSDFVKKDFTIGVPVYTPKITEQMSVNPDTIKEIQQQNSINLIGYYDSPVIELRNNKLTKDYLICLHTILCALNKDGYKILNSAKEYRETMRKQKRNDPKTICGFFDEETKNICIVRDILKEYFNKNNHICPIKEWNEFMIALSNSNISKTHFTKGVKVATVRFPKQCIYETFTPISISELKSQIRDCRINRRFINDLFKDSISDINSN